jgi:hypothetical protein
MTCTLTSVKHIPTMARILILPNTIDSEGYKYRGGNRVLKDMIGDMHSAILYVLRGSTLPGIPTVVTFDEPSKTNLWHARLSI